VKDKLKFLKIRLKCQVSHFSFGDWKITVALSKISEKAFACF